MLIGMYDIFNPIDPAKKVGTLTAYCRIHSTRGMEIEVCFKSEDNDHQTKRIFVWYDKEFCKQIKAHADTADGECVASLYGDLQQFMFYLFEHVLSADIALVHLPQSGTANYDPDTPLNCEFNPMLEELLGCMKPYDLT